ncbi:uncharacterized protein BKA78DRAFT_111081 [Phyllosticta capitalensis]|uniref:uncharacterized protein n=1 Tax=Phyllosticta capitalensis TaxID=121624 RepID=UPI00312F5DE1
MVVARPCSARYKQTRHPFNIPPSHPSCVSCDNQLAPASTSQPASGPVTTPSVIWQVRLPRSATAAPNRRPRKKETQKQGKKKKITSSICKGGRQQQRRLSLSLRSPLFKLPALARPLSPSPLPWPGPLPWLLVGPARRRPSHPGRPLVAVD